MKKILAILFTIVFLVVGFYALNSYIYQQKQGKLSPALNPQDGTYVLDGKVITLVNGEHTEEAAPGSASKIITRYFGNEIRKDLNDDGREDAVFIITQTTGGTGEFYYVVAALNTADGYVGSQGLFLGDRIAPQTTESGAGKIVVVNYADRKPDESFATPPSIGKSVRLILDPETMAWGEVADNFEGEADPSRMNLEMKTWKWISALYNDGREIKPKNTGVFTIAFDNDGRFSATTDCNSMSGSYSANDDELSFSQIAMTKKFCEGSQEGDFAKLLENTSHYHFTSRGELILDLKFDSGSVVLR
ncbi:MAG: META domain-containing protein [Anaplasmataceae bacterium]|nr:META domain-containing protein [Anaplasmataceae bacterium]MBS3903615.1 META domain-containing protein [Anaplasmataceae bacterium]